jgi:hypothetical protein
MSAVHLKNFMWANHSLAYDTRTGAAEERKGVHEGVFAKGYYWGLREGFAGFYASPEGPTVFQDAQRTIAKAGDRGRFDKGADENVFTLSRGGETLVSIRYPPPPPPHYDEWPTDDESRDLFCWLAQYVGADWFVAEHTLPLPGPTGS